MNKRCVSTHRPPVIGYPTIYHYTGLPDNAAFQSLLNFSEKTNIYVPWPPQSDDLRTRDIHFSLHWDKADHSDVIPSLSSICLSVCLWRCCALLRPLNFSAIFFTIWYNSSWTWAVCVKIVGKSKGFYVIVQAKLGGYEKLAQCRRNMSVCLSVTCQYWL